MSNPAYHGSLYIISAPSGAGKTSLVHALTQIVPDLKISISHTTRPPRNNEKNGVNYHFIEPTEFQTMIDAEAFLEYATVFSHLYGTSKKEVLHYLQAGQDVILEIDWQGAALIRQRYQDAISIFILPPSLSALKERLTKRGQDQPAIIEKRLQAATSEMSHYPEFDYLVVNAVFDQAVNDLSSIIHSHRLLNKNHYSLAKSQLNDLGQ